MPRSNEVTDRDGLGKPPQSAEEMVAVIARWTDEVWHQGKLDVVPELLGPTYVRHEPVGTQRLTPKQYARKIAAIRKRLPDFCFTEHDQVVFGDRYWMRWTYQGTDAESGKVVKRAGIQIYRFDQGKIVETWLVMSRPGSDWSK